MGYGLAPALKASMEIIGLSLGKPYPPFKAVEAADLEAMRTYLKTTYLFDQTHQNLIRKRAA
jgi:4-hydroxy-tetrahydrodipicolinate synthase